MPPTGSQSDLDQWTHDTFGEDPIAYANTGPAAAAAATGEIGVVPTAQPATPPANGAAASPGPSARMLVPFEKTIPITPEAPVQLGAYIKLKLSMALKLKGTFELASGPKGGSSVDITPAGYSDGFVERVAHSWYDAEGVKMLGINTGASESKIETQAKVKDGLEVSISGTLKYKSGEELKLKINVVKIESGWKVSAGQLEFNYTFKSIEIKAYLFENVTVKGAVQATAIVKAEPDYAGIAKTVLKDAAETGGGEGALAAADAALDVAIPLALAGVAIGTVLGVADMFARKAKMDDIKATLYPAIRDLRAGLYAGLSGQAASGSTEMYKGGYDLGHQAYQTAMDKVVGDLVKQRGFPPTPDELKDIQHEAEVQARKAIAAWAGVKQIEDRLRWGFFNKWVDENHGYFTFVDAAQDAVLTCFGIGMEPVTGEHMKVWADVSQYWQKVKDIGA
jgi:hypothetical protein